MYSSVPNGTTTESLRSCNLRDNNEGGKRSNEGTVEPLSMSRNSQSNTQNEIGLSRVVTMEHTMSSSSQSSLSRHESHNSMEYTPLKSGQSEEDETVVNSEQVGEDSITTGTTPTSPVRQREKEKEKRAHEKVSWRQSQAGGPTLRDVSPQRNQEEKEEQESGENAKFEKLENLDIALFPTDRLLEMLTALLDKIVKSNDKLVDTNFLHQQQQEHSNTTTDNCLRSVLSFRGKHIPQISLEHYFQRIQKYCPTSNDVFLSLLVYFDRISRKCNSNSHRRHDSTSTDINENNNYESERNNSKQAQNSHQPTPTLQQQFVMDSHNIHRLIIAGTTVSTKFFSDFFYSNSRYARVGGISLQELNYLELQFLILCDFELLISVNELQRYADLLYRFWNKSKPHPSE